MYFILCGVLFVCLVFLDNSYFVDLADLELLVILNLPDVEIAGLPNNGKGFFFLNKN